MMRDLVRRQVAKKLPRPRCQADLEDGRPCPFYSEINGAGYYTGACGNESHQAQLRLRGEFNDGAVSPA